MEKESEELSEMEILIQKDRKFKNIKLKIDSYMKYNNKIKKDMEDLLNVLDEKYNVYQYYLNMIHISIICLSSVASFLLASQHYIHNSNTTIHLTSLCISTYTGLLLSISKFVKLEEKKESLYRLRCAFAEFLIEICSRNDILESWSSHNYWKTREDTPGEHVAHHLSDMIGFDSQQNQNYEICFEEWNHLEHKLKEQMHDIIVKKQELCRQYAQEMDNPTKFRSEISSKRRYMLHKMKLKKLQQAKTEKELKVGINRWINDFLEKSTKNTLTSNKDNEEKNEIIELEKIQRELEHHDEDVDENIACFSIP